MSIVLNFGFSNAFQTINFDEITFPATLYVSSSGRLGQH